VGSWLPCRGGGSGSRHDRFHRAHAHPGSVPGSADLLTDRIHVGRTDALRRVYLSGCVLLIEPGCVLLIERVISAGGSACIPIGVFLSVADRVRIPEVIPVRLPDPDPDPDPAFDPDPDPDSAFDPDPDPDPAFDPDLDPAHFLSTRVLAGIHADISVRVVTGFVVARMPGGALSRGPSGAVGWERRSAAKEDGLIRVQTVRYSVLRP
jgi:hypothetical protein